MSNMTIQSKGGRKTVDAAMNLVPFIDLLSCCISFLLITAVWSQLAAVETHPAGGVTETAASAPSTQLTLFLGEDGYVVSSSTGTNRETETIPRRGTSLDSAKLASVLVSKHAQFPSVSTLDIRARDSVAYHELVGAMDIALGAHFAAVSPQPWTD